MSRVLTRSERAWVPPSGAPLPGLLQVLLAARSALPLVAWRVLW